MAVTKAKPGFGTKIQRGDSGTPTEVFTDIAEVLDVNGPDLTQLFDDATHMESPNGYIENIPTVREAGGVTFQVHFLQDDATHLALLGDLNGAVKRNYRLVLPGQTKRWSFEAYVEKMGASYPVKGKMVRDLALKLNAKPTFENHP